MNPSESLQKTGIYSESAHNMNEPTENIYVEEETVPVEGLSAREIKEEQARPMGTTASVEKRGSPIGTTYEERTSPRKHGSFMDKFKRKKSPTHEEKLSKKETLSAEHSSPKKQGFMSRLKEKFSPHSHEKERKTVHKEEKIVPAVVEEEIVEEKPKKTHHKKEKTHRKKHHAATEEGVLGDSEPTEEEYAETREAGVLGSSGVPFSESAVAAPHEHKLEREERRPYEETHAHKKPIVEKEAVIYEEQKPRFAEAPPTEEVVIEERQEPLQRQKESHWKEEPHLHAKETVEEGTLGSTSRATTAQQGSTVEVPTHSRNIKITKTTVKGSPVTLRFEPEEVVKSEEEWQKLPKERRIDVSELIHSGDKSKAREKKEISSHEK